MTRSRSMTVLVSGMVAAVPRQGGAAWAVLQYVLGLRRLGHEVWLVEQMDVEGLEPEGTGLIDSANAAFFRDVTAAFGLEERSALVLTGSRETVGPPYDRIREVAERADLLLDISGLLTDEDLRDPVPVRVYLDLDPAFTQLWHATQGIDMRFTGHTHFATVGQAIGQPECPVPTCGLDWIPTLPPVVLDEWPAANGLRRRGLTTVGNWRGYGSIEHGGVFYGQKAHSLRQFVHLPLRSGEAFMPALAIHQAEAADLEALASNGWQVLDPLDVANTPERYRRFVRGSWAEFGIAKSGYVASACGWFSDRSACYLASGRPVLAQDTGFPRFLPAGEGLLAFRTPEDVLVGLEELRRDYSRHCRAARAVAEEFLDSDRVLTRLLDLVGAGS